GALVSADIAGTGWRSIFLVNVPVGLVGLVLVRRHVPDSKAPTPAAVDVPGTALFGLAMLALLVPLMEGRALGWPVWTWVSLAVSVPLGLAFVLVESRLERSGRTPLLPPSLLRLRGLRLGLSMAVPFFAGFGGFMFVMALSLQQGVGLGPMAAGAAIAPMAVAAASWPPRSRCRSHSASRRWAACSWRARTPTRSTRSSWSSPCSPCWPWWSPSRACGWGRAQQQRRARAEPDPGPGRELRGE